MSRTVEEQAKYEERMRGRMEKRQGIFDTLGIQSRNSSKALRVASFLEKYSMSPGLTDTQEGRELAYQFEDYANTITSLIHTDPA